MRTLDKRRQGQQAKEVDKLEPKSTVAGKRAHFSLFMGTKRYRRIESILTRSCHLDETW